MANITIPSVDNARSERVARIDMQLLVTHWPYYGDNDDEQPYKFDKGTTPKQAWESCTTAGLQEIAENVDLHQEWIARMGEAYSGLMDNLPEVAAKSALEKQAWYEAHKAHETAQRGVYAGPEYDAYKQAQEVYFEARARLSAENAKALADVMRAAVPWEAVETAFDDYVREHPEVLLERVDSTP
jgi:hypothetical protein